MNEQAILSSIKADVGQEILQGYDVDLDENTALLELGILNSMEIIRLVTFLETEFAVIVPPQQIMPQSFRNLKALTQIVLNSPISNPSPRSGRPEVQTPWRGSLKS
jgi:acyl carrier protein